MKKFPIQFTVDTLALVGIVLFVYWTSNGGLKTQILSVFERQGISQKAREQVGHIGDIIYFCSQIVAGVAIITGLLRLISLAFKPLEQFLPTFSQILDLFLQLIKHLIIFLGIYIYLIHYNSASLKRQKLLLFPFWYLITILLDLLGKVVSSFQKVVNVSSAGFYLRIITFGFMLAQIAGYKPFKLI